MTQQPRCLSDQSCEETQQRKHPGGTKSISNRVCPTGKLAACNEAIFDTGRHDRELDFVTSDFAVPNT